MVANMAERDKFVPLLVELLRGTRNLHDTSEAFGALPWHRQGDRFLTHVRCQIELSGVPEFAAFTRLDERDNWERVRRNLAYMLSGQDLAPSNRLPEYRKRWEKYRRTQQILGSLSLLSLLVGGGASLWISSWIPLIFVWIAGFATQAVHALWNSEHPPKAPVPKTPWGPFSTEEDWQTHERLLEPFALPKWENYQPLPEPPYKPWPVWGVILYCLGAMVLLPLAPVLVPTLLVLTWPLHAALLTWEAWGGRNPLAFTESDDCEEG